MTRFQLRLKVQQLTPAETSKHWKCPICGSRRTRPATAAPDGPRRCEACRHVFEQQMAAPQRSYTRATSPAGPRN